MTGIINHFDNIPLPTRLRRNHLLHAAFNRLHRTAFVANENLVSSKTLCAAGEFIHTFTKIISKMRIKTVKFLFQSPTI